MNKSAPMFPAAGLLGGLCVCLLAFSVGGRGEPPGPSLQTFGTAASPMPVANPEPGAVNVEAPAEEAPTIPANDTEILATQGATFAAKDRIAVFVGDVRVRDPRFTLASDKLTVYLTKTAAPGASPAPVASTPPPVDPAAKTGDDANRGSGIDHAVAEGHVIIIQKRTAAKPGEEEKVSIGRSDTAEFDNKTGDMTLRGMPRVEQNGNSHEALSRSTFMILHRDNSLETHGPSRTLIVPHDKDTPGNSPGGKAGSTPPSGTPLGRRTPTSGTRN